MAFVVICFSLSALADGTDNDVLKKLLGATGGKATIKPVENNDPLRLTTNKDRLIRLDQDAASVIVNNPAHLVVMLDSPRLMILMPRQPGATSFTVLDGEGKVVLHKEVVVTNVQPDYVRIRRICSFSTDGTCAPSSYFYCPDGCYEVTSVGDADNSNVPAPSAAPSAASPANAGGGGNGGPPLAPPQQPLHSTTMPAIPGSQ
jgi:hypothetical protein